MAVIRLKGQDGACGHHALGRLLLARPVSVTEADNGPIERHSDASEGEGGGASERKMLE